MLKRLFIFFFFSSFMGMAFSQTLPLPKDHPVSIAAPHLPLMVRYDGTGKVFYGEKYTYKLELNEGSIKDWMKNYPDELPKYKDAISSYLKNTDTALLSDTEKELYSDLKSQWYMIVQL